MLFTSSVSFTVPPFNWTVASCVWVVEVIWAWTVALVFAVMLCRSVALLMSKCTAPRTLVKFNFWMVPTLGGTLTVMSPY